MQKRARPQSLPRKEILLVPDKGKLQSVTIFSNSGISPGDIFFVRILYERHPYERDRAQYNRGRKYPRAVHSADHSFAEIAEAFRCAEPFRHGGV